MGRKLLKRLLARSADSSNTSAHSGAQYRIEGSGQGEKAESDDSSVEDDEHHPTSEYLSSSLQSCADLWSVPLSTLTSWAGGPAIAKSLYEACRGRDKKQLKDINLIASSRKSVGAEVNYGHRYETDECSTAMAKAEAFLVNLCEEVIKRLAQVEVNRSTLVYTA